MKQRNKPMTVLTVILMIVSMMLQPGEVNAAEQLLPSGVERVQLEEKIDEYV